MSQTVNLPFTSQQQLLARLLHLSRLDTDFILLTGPQGAGKSHLGKLLVEQSTLMLPVMLDAKALDSHTRFRDALFGHWFPDAIFDAEDSLIDTMTRLLPASLHKRLLVVDNSAWLTDIQLQELVQLYVTLPAAIRPFMLLLGTAEWAGQVRQQLDDAMLANLLEVEIPPLTEADKRQLWQALEFQPSLDASRDIQYPGEVIDTMEPQMNTQGYRQLLEQKSVKILLTTLIVVLLLIVIVSLVGGPDKTGAELTQSNRQEQAALPAPIPDGATISGGQSAVASSEAGSAVVQEWPAESLPATPVITATDTQTADDSDKERVIIEDDVVTQLMQRESQAQQPAAQPQRPVEATPPEPATPVTEATANLGSVESLMQKSSQRYTLQLMAGRNRSVLEALVAKHNLSPAWIYPRSINGQPWFVLVQGDYLSAGLARNAISGLASELQAAKPWPKPFSQVQKEVQP
ncbi:SPOR domain-containing protein [Oceanisphaera sp.]|uniref:SPOR domain-containing protein n=1 Tax=Oceanisphaera sp. TaxID=1929979 RepID=UPI003A9581D4